MENSENQAKKNEEQRIAQRKDKLKSWLKDPYHLALICVLIFAFVLYMYYFKVTINQPLWYDEGEYMSAANKWAFGIPYDIHKARPPLFSFLALFILKAGLGLLGVKFLLEFVPTMLSLLVIYLFVKEAFNDKRLAVISAFILSVSWIHIFYAMRLMTDALGFLFGLLAFLCFWKGYINNKGKVYIWLVGFFVALSFMCRLTGILYGGFLFIFLLLTDKFHFLKNKHVWISLIIGILAVTPYLIWSYSYYGNATAFLAGYGGAAETAPGWWMLNLVYDYPELIFFIFFWFGVLAVLPMLLSLDLIIFKRDKKLLADFFVSLLIIFTLFFFIYFLRLGENRWLMMMSIGIFILSGKGILLVSDFIKKSSSRRIALAFILLVLAGGAYYQITHTTAIIESKKDSYAPVKEAAIWMKENSNPEDIIITASVTQNTFYSERRSITYFDFMNEHYYTEQELTALIAELKPKYYVVSVFEPTVAQWTLTYPQNKSNFTPVKAWFSDATQQQPILIVYEISY